MKYNLRFEEICLYEVEAESEEEALKVPVPTFGHRASITIQSNSGYGKNYNMTEPNINLCELCIRTYSECMNDHENLPTIVYGDKDAVNECDWFIGRNE